MARDLGDVADYFLPRAGAAGTRAPARRTRAMAAPDQRGSPGERPAALPIVGIPIGERDVVRAAFAWNLAVEVARLGGSATLVAPSGEEPSPLWPGAGPGPVGAEVLLEPSCDLAALSRRALDVAVERAAESDAGGVVLVRLPIGWLAGTDDGARALLRWVLVFTSSERSDLRECYALVKRIFAAHENARVGVTVHGARRVSDAQSAYGLLAGVSARHLGRSLHSYGLLVDDLHIYRAIVAQRPIGLEHPQSRAARALRDVARLLLEDARMLAIA